MEEVGDKLAGGRLVTDDGSGPNSGCSGSKESVQTEEIRQGKCLSLKYKLKVAILLSSGRHQIPWLSL